jgi:hypothetical protein
VVDPGAYVVAQTRAGEESDLILTLGVTPVTAGQNPFDLYVSDQNNEPLLMSELVVLRVNNRTMNTGESEVVLQLQGNGHYVARAGNLSLLGHWQVTAIVRRFGVPDGHRVFTLDLH